MLLMPRKRKSPRSRLKQNCMVLGNRDTILKLLLDGARELGHIVCSHIRALLNELHNLRRRTGGGDASASASAAGPSAAAAATSPAAAGDEGDAEAAERTRGVLQDRFTKDFVVVAAQTKPKTGGYELQLPSMASLTSKTSSQAFFLRILKVSFCSSSSFLL